MHRGVHLTGCNVTGNPNAQITAPDFTTDRETMAGSGEDGGAAACFFVT